MSKITDKITAHSIHIVILLILALTVGSIGIGILVQRNILIQGLDNYFYTLIADGPHYDWLDFLIKPFNYNFLPVELSPGRMPSYYYIMFLATAFYLAIMKRSLFLWAVFCFVGGTILAYWITFLDWHFVFRSRPFLTLPNPVDDIGRAAWSQLSSFPSGHSRETALYATLISNFIPRLKWIMVVFVIFIAYSRVYLGAHYPTDVIAGVLIGYLTAKTILIVSRELQILIQKRTGGKHEVKPKQSYS